MNLHKLRVFCEVVERQSLTEAAEHLVVSQPVVSAHIHDLETFFCAKLLHRRRGCMLPTEAGRAVYDYAVQVLQATEKTTSLVQALRLGEAGQVRVGANAVPGTYILPPLLTAFKVRHPKTAITLGMSDPATVCDRLTEGRYDFAVVTELDPPHGVDRELLMQAPVVFVCDPHHRLASEPLATLNELSHEKWVCRPSTELRRPVIDTLLRSVGLVDRKVEMALSHSEAIKQAVRAGVGIAAMFECSVRSEIERGELVEVRIEDQRLQLPIYIIHHGQKRFSPVQRQVLEFVKRGVRAPPRVDSSSTTSPRAR